MAKVELVSSAASASYFICMSATRSPPTNPGLPAFLTTLFVMGLPTSSALNSSTPSLATPPTAISYKGTLTTCSTNSSLCILLFFPIPKGFSLNDNCSVMIRCSSDECDTLLWCFRGFWEEFWPQELLVAVQVEGRPEDPVYRTRLLFHAKPDAPPPPIRNTRINCAANNHRSSTAGFYFRRRAAARDLLRNLFFYPSQPFHWNAEESEILRSDALFLFSRSLLLILLLSVLSSGTSTTPSTPTTSSVSSDISCTCSSFDASKISCTSLLLHIPCTNVKQQVVYVTFSEGFR